jgi:hypothetical protein
MATADLMREFFTRVIEGLGQDAANKGQKFPIDKLRFEADEISAAMYGPDYVEYLFYGRGPGKFPPPDKMTAWVEANPDVLDQAKKVFKYITSQQLGYLIGRKIAREGTDIFTGKKPGIDLLGVMDKNMPELLKDLARNEAVKIATELKSAIKQPVTSNV